MPEITNFPGASGYDAKGVPTIPATFPVDPAPQFRAAWLHIAKMSNRVVGTTAERALTDAWAWDGLAFFDTTVKREYVRLAGAWKPSGIEWSHQTVGAGSTDFPAPPPGTAPIIKTGYLKTTLAGGTVQITFETPFPNKALSASVVPIEGTAIVPVIDSRGLTPTKISATYPGGGGAAVAMVFTAIGW